MRDETVMALWMFVIAAFVAVVVWFVLMVVWWFNFAESDICSFQEIACVSETPEATP